MQVTDPVCRRRLPLETVVAHREFKAGSYFFCSLKCVQLFDESPEEFAQQKPAGPPSGMAKP